MKEGELAELEERREMNKGGRSRDLQALGQDPLEEPTRGGSHPHSLGPHTAHPHVLGIPHSWFLAWSP